MALGAQAAGAGTSRLSGISSPGSQRFISVPGTPRAGHQLRAGEAALLAKSRVSSEVQSEASSGPLNLLPAVCDACRAAPAPTPKLRRSAALGAVGAWTSVGFLEQKPWWKKVRQSSKIYGK